MNLGSSGPRVGDTLRFQGQDWEVTEVSDYTDDEGFESREWCCETRSEEAYLIRETPRSGDPRWFFTRWIESSDVEFEKGASIPDWRANLPAPEAPKSLRYQGQAFRYDDVTEGLYEHEGDEKVSKLTWDYWDAGRKRNVAVELWGDGGSDCYCGSYIKPEDVEILGGGSAFRAPAEITLWDLARSANPFVCALRLIPLCYLLPMFTWEAPFDESFPVALLLASLFALGALQLPALYNGACAVLAAGLAALFGRFHPLASPLGLCGVVGAPALFVQLTRDGPEDDAWKLCYVACLCVALPAGFWGYYHYYAHAPPPHTLGQLCLALGPAAAGGAASALVAWGMLAVEERA